MGIRYSIVQPQQYSGKKIDDSLDKKEEEDVLSQEKDTPSKLDHVYVLCHNKTICSYIEDKKSIEDSINHYMKHVFTSYISRWDSFNYYVVRRNPLEESNLIDDYGLVTDVTLMSRSKNFILSYDKIEEVLEIYKIPRFIYKSLSDEEDIDDEEETTTEEETNEDDEKFEFENTTEYEASSLENKKKD
jgi:hypothetical protein